jgi:UDPglucose--hexose-1-phosphate uridylyltransferase
MKSKNPNRLEIDMKKIEFTHRRRNLLTGDWVLVSPNRNNRPWQGAIEAHSTEPLPRFVESCPLCPGNSRANTAANPNYQFTHVFSNDFAALVKKSPIGASIEKDTLLEADIALGTAKVICFSPDHNKSLPQLNDAEMIEVIKTWQSVYIELQADYHCIHIFENKGEIMGCSQPHPHGQIWAHNHWSNEIRHENQQQTEYFQKNSRSLLADYIEKEANDGSRTVVENADWIVVVPYWAAWPYETLLVAKSDRRDMGHITQSEQVSLASIVKELTVRYDNLFNCSFPYSMGWHNAPTNLTDSSHWRLHAHFYPPLLRSATVKKHMVGYEMLAESQRDITAEQAAETLRSVSSIHYLISNNNKTCKT